MRASRSLPQLFNLLSGCCSALPGIRNEISTDTSFRRPRPAGILKGGGAEGERFSHPLGARRWLLTRRVKSGNHRRESICSFALWRLKKFPIVSTLKRERCAFSAKRWERGKKSREWKEREKKRKREREGLREKSGRYCRVFQTCLSVRVDSRIEPVRVSISVFSSPMSSWDQATNTFSPAAQLRCNCNLRRSFRPRLHCAISRRWGWRYGLRKRRVAPLFDVSNDVTFRRDVSVSRQWNAASTESGDTRAEISRRILRKRGDSYLRFSRAALMRHVTSRVVTARKASAHPLTREIKKFFSGKPRDNIALIGRGQAAKSRQTDIYVCMCVILSR